MFADSSLTFITKYCLVVSLNITVISSSKRLLNLVMPLISNDSARISVLSTSPFGVPSHSSPSSVLLPSNLLVTYWNLSNPCLRTYMFIIPPRPISSSYLPGHPRQTYVSLLLCAPFRGGLTAAHTPRALLLCCTGFCCFLCPAWPSSASTSSMGSLIAHRFLTGRSTSPFIHAAKCSLAPITLIAELSAHLMDSNGDKK